MKLKIQDVHAYGTKVLNCKVWYS